MIEDVSGTSVEGVLDLLSATSRLLGSSLDAEAALPEIAELLVPQLAGGCAIGLIEGSGLRVACRTGKVTLEGGPRAWPGRSGGVRAEDGGWILDATIVVRGETLGLLRLAGPGRPAPVLPALTDDLALRIGLAIDMSRRLDRERRVADTLQRALLPERLPQPAGIRFDAAYLPGASETIVGGDWYDAFELPDGAIAVSIGDVAGHGLSAAVVMSEVRQSVRAAALSTSVPSEVLQRANQMLTMRSAPTMVTALYGIFDPRTSIFTYATAGQPAPFLATSEARVQALPAGGLPLGIVDDLQTCDWTFSVLPGSMLVMYTDGLIEFKRDIEAGEAGLRRAIASEIVSPTGSPAKSLHDRVFAEFGNTDDVATLTLSTQAGRIDRLRYTFSAVPIAAPIVRRAVERYASEIGLGGDATFALVSAIGEAVANAVEHAYDGRTSGLVTLVAHVEDEALHVEIEDSGCWRVTERREERGRGIPMMRALMDGFDIRTGDATTVVRMHLNLRRDELRAG